MQVFGSFFRLSRDLEVLLCGAPDFFHREGDLIDTGSLLLNGGGNLDRFPGRVCN